MDISSEDANAMNEYVCNECVQKQKTVEEEELYCLCRQPYDETKYVHRVRPKKKYVGFLFPDPT